MHDVVLVHRSGPDRDAVTSFLEKASLRVTVIEAESASQFVSAESIFVIESELVATVPPGRLRSHRLVILGTGSTNPLPEGTAVLSEPYFLPDLVKAIETAAAPRAPSAPSPRSIAAASDLLRSLTHALANPLSGAQGWMQLLATDLVAPDPRARALKQARQDLLRLERMLQLFSWIGGRECSQSVPVDLGALLRDRIRPVVADGLDVRLELPDRQWIFQGDPTPIQMVIDALLHAYLEERTRSLRLTIHGEGDGDLVFLRFTDEGGTVPIDLPCHDLPVLLKRTRTSRALGLSLAHRLTQVYPGTTILVTPDLAPGTGGAIEWRLAPVQVGVRRMLGSVG